MPYFDALVAGAVVGGVGATTAGGFVAIGALLAGALLAGALLAGALVMGKVADVAGTPVEVVVGSVVTGATPAIGYVVIVPFLFLIVTEVAGAGAVGATTGVIATNAGSLRLDACASPIFSRI
jgi:hypothetical protein